MDQILNWLLSGGKLASDGAAMAIGAIISVVIIPTAQIITKRFNLPFVGPLKTQAVYVSGVAVAFTIGALTHSITDGNHVLVIGIEGAMYAMGIHQTVKQGVRAARAIAQQEKLPQ